MAVLCTAEEIVLIKEFGGGAATEQQKERRQRNYEAGKDTRCAMEANFESYEDLDPRMKHRPRLDHTLRQLRRGALDETRYPFLDEPQQRGNPGLDVIVFFVGGYTMQESRIVHEFNQESRTLRRTGGLGAAYHVLCGADVITNASRTIKQAHRARPRPAFLERMPPATADELSMKCTTLLLRNSSGHER